jgi:isocitrate/isopropylmalate dehydrogenase
MRTRRYTVACLAGDGIGPELMGEASRAVAAVSRLHGFRVDETHVPFGGDAVRRFGHPLPPATRAACREADAVLIAATREPALEGIKAELDLTWRITRVRLARHGDVALVSPVADDAEELAIERAFAIACSRRAKVTSSGTPA